MCQYLQDYYKTLEDAEEKVSLANQIYELVDKYLRRLDQELQKFKIELEADNAGITEILERSQSPINDSFFDRLTSCLPNDRVVRVG